MKKHTPYQLILESLEERVFFDANPAAAIIEPTDGGGEEVTPDGAQMQADSESAVAAQETTVNQVDGGDEQPTDDSSSADQSDILESEPQEAGELLLDNEPASEEGDQDNSTTEMETADPDEGILVEQGAADKSEVDRVVFVDDNIKDFDNLLVGVATDVSQLDESFNIDGLLETRSQVVGDTEIVVLDHESDELGQITETLAGYEGLGSVHIFSYGSQNSLTLGDTTLTTSNLDNYASQITEWGEALSENGDFLLYGCNIAQDVTENNFIEAFAQLTEADVAASDDQTGNQAIGGDWDLEVTSGDVETITLQDATGQWDGLLDPVADSTLSADNTEPMINSTFDFEVTFDNTDGVDVGYGPFVDVVVPATLDITGGPEYLEQPVAHDIYTWDAVAGAWLDTDDNEVTVHPFDNDTQPFVLNLPAGADDGDKWYLVELPFGSFTPDQPIAAIAFDATTSESAQVGVDIDIISQAGFRYGDSATNDNGPLQEADTNTLTITPQVIDIEKSNNAPEDQTATGPNYPVEYTLTVNVAAGETVEDVIVQDYLPENAVYRGDVTITDSNDANVSVVSIDAPNEFEVLGAASADRLLQINFGDITGVENAADAPLNGTSEYQITYTVYFSDVQSDTSTLLPGTGGDVNDVLNEASVTGTYNAVTVSDGIDVGVDLDNLNGNDNDTLSDNQIQIASLVTYKDVTVVSGDDPFPGETLEWRIEVNISDYYSADNIVLNDVFGDGQTYDSTFAPTLEVFENGTTNSYTFAGANFTVGDEDALSDVGDTELIFRVSDQLFTETGDRTLEGGVFADGITASADDGSDDLNGRIGGDGTRFFVVYRTVIDQEFDEFHTDNSNDSSVDIGDEIYNRVTVNADISDGINVDAQEDSSEESLFIPGGEVEKTIFAVNGDTAYDLSNGVQSGDRVTYRLKMELPSADFERLIVRDFLPLPVYDAGELIAIDDDDFNTDNPDTGTEEGLITYVGGEIAFGPDHNLNNSYIAGLAINNGSTPVTSFLAPTVTVDVINNAVELDFGSYDATSSTAATIDILLTVTINNEPIADELMLTNQGEWSINDTNQSPDLEVEIQQVTMNAPEVEIIKGVVGIGDSNGTLAGSQGPLTFNADGTISTINTTSGVVEAADLIDTPVDANLTDADGGDVVTFALTIYNTGGDDAFDINVTDQLPTGFVRPGNIGDVNLHVYQGSSATEIDSTLYTASLNGAADTLTVNFSGVALAGDPENRVRGGGNDVFIVTYQLTVDNETATDPDIVTAGSTHTNTATVDFFTGTDNSTTDWTEVLTEPTDDANVSIALPTATKTIVDTNQTSTDVNNVVIGEQVKYQITVDVPEGRLDNLVITDTLDAGLAFVGFEIGDAAIVNAADGAGVNIGSAELQTTLGNIVSNTNTPGDGQVAVNNNGHDIIINLGDIVNGETDNDDVEQITFSYWAVVLNTTGNQQNTALDNNVSISWDSGPGVTTTADQDVIVQEADLEVDKKVGILVDDNAAGIGDDWNEPGMLWYDTLNLDQADENIAYKITVRHSVNSNEDAFDVSFTDTLPGNITWTTPTVTNVEGKAVTGITFAEVGGEWTLTANWDVLNYNTAPGTSEYTTFIITGGSLVSAGGGQVINNGGRVEWESLDGDQGTPISTFNNNSYERTGDANDPGQENNYNHVDDAEITINGGIDKVLTNSGPYTIGDLVEYRIDVTLPEGELADLVITDQLPTGLELVSSSIVWTGFRNDAANPLNTDPTSSPSSGDTGSLVWDFTGADDTNPIVIPDDNDSDNNSFSITVRARVENIAANDSGDVLTNHVSMNFGGSTVVEDPTDPSITLVEPQITTTKTVVDSSGDTEAGALNEIMTYMVVMENTGNATAYEVSLTDKLPDGTELVGVTSIAASQGGAIETNINSITFTNTDGLLGFSHESWDVAVGETLTIEYNVRVVEAWFVGGDHTNSADADWTGLNGTDDNERIYDDSDTRNPGMSQDGTQDTATATFTVPLGDGTIGDRVWFDANADRIQDAGETGIAGVTVTAQVTDTNNPGNIVYDLTAITDSSGNYSFTHLPDANYDVRVDPSTLPAGMEQTFDYALDQGTNVLDHTGSHEITDSAGGEIFLNVDFGYTGIGSIGDYVWYDANLDGIQNEANLGINGATVTIAGDLDGDGIFEYTATETTGNDSNGNPGYYLFEHLPFADYTITVSNLPNNVTEPTFDFDGVATSSTTAISKDAISATNDIRNIDFGYVGTGLIGDTVWNDINADGVQDPGENGLNGVTVTLSGVDLNNDGTSDTLTTVTGTDGSYEFAGLPPGEYTVTVDSSTIPSGYIQSGDPDTVKDHTSNYNLALDEQNRSQDFGYTETGSIGDTVWYDIDGDGVQDVNEPGLAGIEVTLLGDVDLDGNQDTFTTVTDNNGKYLFDNLPTGEYLITVNGDDLPAGMVPTYDEDGIATLHTTDVTLGNGDDNLDIDFGYRGTGSIGDTVWYDRDEDGVVDPGEEGLAGVKITLEGDFDGDGVTDIVLETETDANGNYSFENLFAGDYSITSDFSTIPGNYYPVYDADGTLDNTTTVILGAGEVNNNVDFGYRPVPVQPEPSTPLPVVPPGPVVPGSSYDPLFRSIVGLGETRDVQDFIEMRRDDSVFQEPLLPVSPMYTGHAEPGTTLYINLTDAQGNLVGSQLVMADTGGNWLANFSGTLLYDMPHNIDIQQDLSLYNASSAGGFNLRTYFMPAISMSPFTMSQLTLESIFATRPFAILETLGEHYNQGANLAWNDFYDYEYKAVSTNPAQSTL